MLPLKIFPRKILFAIFLLINIGAYAQKVAIKTNILHDALLSVNLGTEIGIMPKWSVDFEGSYKGWNLNKDKVSKFWLFQPEIRYWNCDRFMRSFWGLHINSGKYNLGGLKNNIKFLGTDFSLLSNKRYEGWIIGAGIGYGYSFILNRCLNIETEIGFGYVYTKYNIYKCTGCGKKIGNRSNNYVGPTKLAINLVYTF